MPALFQIIWTIVGMLVAGGVGIIVRFVVARDPSAKIDQLASLGADNIVIRELVKTPERRDVLLGSAMLLKLAGAALAMTTVVTAVVFSATLMDAVSPAPFEPITGAWSLI